MKILVIGGTGHVGTPLVKILAEQGHDVVICSRGKLPSSHTYPNVRSVVCDSSDLNSLNKLAEQETFDAIVDFPGTAWNVWCTFKDKVNHIIACGSMWMFGYPRTVPTPELTQNSCCFGGYIERYDEIITMISENFRYKAAFTAVMPPNICGPGKIPLDTLGGRDIEVHKANMRGETVYLPDGPEALICPCDAYDLAMVFALAINNRTNAAGQIFNGGTEHALTASQFVNTMGEIHGTTIPIEYVSWQEYRDNISPSIGHWWHFYAHMCPDISKAKKLLGCKPRYTSEEALARAVVWMKEQKLL